MKFTQEQQKLPNILASGFVRNLKEAIYFSNEFTNFNKDSNFINQTQINKIIEQLNTYANDNGLTSITHTDIASNQNLMQLVMSGWNA